MNAPTRLTHGLRHRRRNLFVFVWSAFFIAWGNAHAASLEKWTAQKSGTANNLNGIAANGRVFVAVGDKGTILLSPDGTSWHTEASNTTADLHAVTWGCNLFIAVGSHGFIAISADGTNWSQRISFTDQNLWCVAGNDMMLVAGGDNTTLRRSVGGFLWERVNSLGARVRFQSAFWDGREFVFACPTGLAHTRDGLRWQFASEVSAPRDPAAPADKPPRLNAANFNAVGGRRDQLHAVGNDGKHYTAPGFLSWQAVENPERESLFGIAASDHHTVVAGENGTIEVSEDGLHWLKRETPTKADLHAAVNNGLVFAVVGAHGTILTSAEWARAEPPAILPHVPHPLGEILREPKQIFLVSPTPGATVRYTRDGSEVTADSPVFDWPFWVEYAQTLRARSYKDGMDPSEETKVVYVAQTPPVIVKQPVSAHVYVGDDASFMVEANGVPLPDLCRWQVLKPNAKAWTDFKVVQNQFSLPIPHASLDQNGWQFRCVVENAVGNVTSQEVSLDVLNPVPPEVTEEPKSVIAHVGETARFSVAAKASPQAHFGWEMLPKGTKSSLLIPRGVMKDQGSSLVIGPIPESMSGKVFLFHCRVNNRFGETYSHTVSLTVVR